MPLLLLIAFIVVPLVELAVIGRVNDWLGLPATLALLLLDSVIGAVLVKREGRRAWLAFRTALTEARWPGDEVVQGALVLVGGALLLTPGFVTDAVGLAAVLPPTRRLLSRALRARLTPAPVRLLRTTTGGARPGSAPGGRRRSPGRVPDDDVVEQRRRRSHAEIDVEVVSVERDGPEDGPAGSSGVLDRPKG
ncbi:MAG: FxsA family protein [Actinobacteria bacterium]|nr:FxsA family protein [Actinomycetota bacterium]